MRRRASCLFLLAAILWWGGLSALAIRPDFQETRVGGCEVNTSGQTSAAASQTVENAMGCGGCGYKTASGQWRWLNEDPLGENGGINLYRFVHNNPPGFIDPDGQGLLSSIGNAISSVGDALVSPVANLWAGAAQAQGVSDINNMLNALGYDGMSDFQSQNPGYNGRGNVTAGDSSAASAAANLASGATQTYLDLAQGIATGGLTGGGGDPVPGSGADGAAAGGTGKDAADAAKALQKAIKCKNGTKVLGFTKHGIHRAIGDGAKRAGVTPQAFLDALQNPEDIISGIDDQGRPFEQFVGQNAQVVVNPQTGQVVSTNPLSGAGAH